MSKIEAPFSEDQIKSLQGFQECGYCHPFTCGDCGASLEPTVKGWICSEKNCSYTQNWCHSFMADFSWRMKKSAKWRNFKWKNWLELDKKFDHNTWNAIINDLMTFTGRKLLINHGMNHVY